MPESHDDIETRVTILEREAVRLREQVATEGLAMLGTGMAQITAMLTPNAGSGQE